MPSEGGKQVETALGQWTVSASQANGSQLGMEANVGLTSPASLSLLPSPSCLSSTHPTRSSRGESERERRHPGGAASNLQISSWPNEKTKATSGSRGAGGEDRTRRQLTRARRPDPISLPLPGRRAHGHRRHGLRDGVRVHLQPRLPRRRRVVLRRRLPRPLQVGTPPHLPRAK
jgi:hypothetical protein